VALERQEIRKAIVKLLIGATDAGTRVGDSRARAVWREGLPAIQVYTARADWEVFSAAGPEYRVRLQVAIEIYVEESASGPADEQVDTIADQVLAVLLKYPTLRGAAADGKPISEETDFDAAKKKLGAARVLWEAQYFVRAPEGEPGELGEFEKVHTEWHLEPRQDDEIDAVDLRTIPT